MNNRQKWQAAKQTIVTKCGTMTQKQLIHWFYKAKDDTCTRLAIYGYLCDNFERPFNPSR